jgi:hypothetical protein
VAVTDFLARDLVIEVDSDLGHGDPVGATWSAIGGLNSVTHSPKTDVADTSDFDGHGRATHLVVQRGDEWSLAGFAKLDVDSGDKDPGQDACEQLAKLIGLESMGQFRMTSPGGNTITFDASVEVTLPGGGHNDAAAWAAKLTVSGDITYA